MKLLFVWSLSLKREKNMYKKESPHFILNKPRYQIYSFKRRGAHYFQSVIKLG